MGFANVSLFSVGLFVLDYWAESLHGWSGGQGEGRRRRRWFGRTKMGEILGKFSSFGDRVRCSGFNLNEQIGGQIGNQSSSVSRLRAK